MPKCCKNLKYFLVHTCEILNFIFAVPFKMRVALVVVDTLTHTVLFLFWLTKTFDCRQTFSFYMRSYSVHTISDLLSIKNNETLLSRQFENRRQIHTIDKMIMMHLYKKRDVAIVHSSCINEHFCISIVMSFFFHLNYILFVNYQIYWTLNFSIRVTCSHSQRLLNYWKKMQYL